MGDSRGDKKGINESVLRILLQRISELHPKPSFILFNGDMICNGKKEPQELERWKSISNNYFPITSFFLSIGNHDGSESNFSEVFSHLPYEQFAGYKRTTYYFDYENTRFIILNSNRKDKRKHYTIDFYQRQWFENVLKESTKTHAFVMFHIPAFPIGPHYGGSLDANPKERDALWSIIDKYKVTSVFTSHEHNYNRRLINSSFSGGGYKFEKEIYQITSGGSGAPLKKNVKDNRGVKSGPFGIYHYIVVDIINKTAQFSVCSIKNELLDSFWVER